MNVSLISGELTTVNLDEKVFVKNNSYSYYYRLIKCSMGRFRLTFKKSHFPYIVQVTITQVIIVVTPAKKEFIT